VAERNFSAMPDFTLQIPDGDSRDRLVCTTCGHIDYQNPKVVVGAVVSLHGQILLCRRAIEPRRGFWTLPAGYLELGETVEEGARREAYEEAQVRIALDGILAIYSISRIGQVQVIFRAGFADPARPEYGAGPESEAVELFAWEDIPWDDIAFPSVRWALAAWRETAGGGLTAPAGNPPSDPRGTGLLAAN
jgi:ADP-ribose pyrophosphatase YjhB (NUDIX family)